MDNINMDSGPLWSKDDAGNYWLVFPNKHALSIEEIKDIFSKFGKVKQITTAGNEKGLRFVQYTTLQDVKNAVDNLKNHPTVKLVPHRQKNKRITNSDGSSKDSLGKNCNSQQVVTNNNNNIQTNFYQRNSTMDNNLKNSFQSVSSNSDSKSIFEQIKNLKVSSSDNVSICSSNFSDGEASCSGQSSGNKSSTKSSSFTTSKLSNNTITDSCLIQYDELPALITKPKSKSKCQQRMEFLNAEEIIVGNIHNDYGCAYILHLFEKYEPLAISYMQTVPKSNTRYCHVYFKSLQDSLKVETIFDKYNLSGQKLIVLRPCRLIDEKS